MGSIVAEEASEVVVLRQQVKLLEEQLYWLKRHMFGRKKETIIDDGNYLPMDLGEPDEPVCDIEPQEEKTIKVSKKRRKFSRFDFPLDAPRETEIHDLSESEKFGLQYIGDDVVEKLAFRSGSYYVKVIITKKYADAGRPELGILTAATPVPAIPGSRIDESMLAALLVDKYCDHLPLYRLEGKYSRDGLDIKRQTLSSWALRAGRLLQPLVNLLFEEIMGSKSIFTDDSTIPLLKKGNGGCKTSRIWVYVGGSGGDPPLVYYQFTENRKKIHVLDKFKNYKGAFHSDALSVYEELAQRDDITWQPCWAHARRNFFDAQTKHPLKKSVLTDIDKLFEVERQVWAIENEPISSGRKNHLKLLLRRKECSVIVERIFDSIKDSFRSGVHMPKEKLTLAICYMMKREQYFKSFLGNPDLRIDNNVSERNIKPVILGRKNWLFVGSENGGQTTATVMSLVQTCKNLKINPRTYLEDALRKINNTPKENLHTLLPHKWEKTE